MIKRLRVGTLKVAVMCVGGGRKGDAKSAMGLSPFRGFWDMQTQMNRMFNEMLGNLGGQRPGRQLEGVTEWAPAVDATTKDGNLVIRAELPGVKPEDVDISLHENVLTISGERKAEQEEERGGYYIRERRYGSFSRSFSLPQGTARSNEITADPCRSPSPHVSPRGYSRASRFLSCSPLSTCAVP